MVDYVWWDCKKCGKRTLQEIVGIDPEKRMLTLLCACGEKIVVTVSEALKW